MAMFEQFRSVDKADLGTSQALENHALLVMNALDEAITNMDDPEFLVDMLLNTGKSHQRFENFSMQIFWVYALVSSLDFVFATCFRWSYAMLAHEYIHFIAIIILVVVVILFDVIYFFN